MPDDASSGVEIPMTSKQSKEVLISLGQKINFIDVRLQCFEYSDYELIVMCKEKMSGLLKTIPALLPTKKLMITKKIRRLSRQ